MTVVVGGSQVEVVGGFLVVDLVVVDGGLFDVDLVGVVVGFLDVDLMVVVDLAVVEEFGGSISGGFLTDKTVQIVRSKTK